MTTTVRIDTQTRELARAVLAARPGIRNQSELIHLAVTLLAERTIETHAAPADTAVPRSVIERLRDLHAHAVPLYSPTRIGKRTTTRRPYPML